MIVGPTSPTPAFKIGEKTDDPLAMYLSDIYTISANLAGMPGISIPCGFTKAGLPIGLQILARAVRGGEAAADRPHVRARNRLAHAPAEVVKHDFTTEAQRTQSGQSPFSSLCSLCLCGELS